MLGSRGPGGRFATAAGAVAHDRRTTIESRAKCSLSLARTIARRTAGSAQRESSRA